MLFLLMDERLNKILTTGHPSPQCDTSLWLILSSDVWDYGKDSQVAQQGSSACRGLECAPQQSMASALEDVSQFPVYKLKL